MSLPPACRVLTPPRYGSIVRAIRCLRARQCASPCLRGIASFIRVLAELGIAAEMPSVRLFLAPAVPDTKGAMRSPVSLDFRALFSWGKYEEFPSGAMFTKTIFSIADREVIKRSDSLRERTD